ncbi:MAG TPA: hypothetical protein VFE58_14275 [Tepidisphaeraceae bacterium]|nr:hypothetical protein [Tepidisphaeraceae bacterium]
MLLLTNSYIVPREKRDDHARLVKRFRHILASVGCDQYEVYEQVGPVWAGADASGRYVQIMRFRDRKHYQTVQEAEQASPDAQQIIREFCDLINIPYQEHQGLYSIAYYASVISSGPVTE